MTAPDQTPATILAYAQRILRALADDDTNNWVRYWRARADCDVKTRDGEGVWRTRVLMALTSAICRQLNAFFGVNPADHPPRGKDRGAGLTLNEPGAAAGYTLFALWHDTQKVYLIDPLGRTAHIWRIEDDLPQTTIIHAKLLDNGNLLMMADGPRAIRMLLEIDPRGNVVWQYTGGRRLHLHHDFLKMPNGNVMLLVRARKTREETIAAGANPEFVHEGGIEYDYLLEVRPTGASGGEVVWEWSVWDHLIQDFDPTKPNYGAIAAHPERIDINFLLETLIKRPPHDPRDWTHANAIDYNPELDQIMLSPRHFSELWIIDHSATTEEARGNAGGNSGMGGDLLYRWGNPRAYGRGDASDQRLFWQHQPHWIPPDLPGAGNILAFNNGWEFAGDERFYSSVDEIAPPVDGYLYRRAEGEAYPPDKLAWTYAAETPADFYAPVVSGAQRLPNGNTLIAHGPAGTIFQTTSDGRIVWKYIVPRHYHSSLWQDSGAPARLTYGSPDKSPASVVKKVVYRAYWYPPDHPGLQRLDLAPGAYLEGDEDLLDWARATFIEGDFGKRLADARYDIYLANDGDENILIYFKRPCAAEDTRAKFFLSIIPTDVRDLPAHRRERGFIGSDFNFEGGDVHALYDWCIALRMLPRYPIERIRTGQYVAESGVKEWQADIDLAAHLAAQAAYKSIAAGDYGEPVAQSNFDIYLSGNTLTYLKEPCAPGDADARFFLHIFPANVGDLPAHRQEHGFDNLDFRHHSGHVYVLDDWCIAMQRLPGYPIERIRTGQFIYTGDPLWRADIELGD